MTTFPKYNRVKLALRLILTAERNKTKASPKNLLRTLNKKLLPNY